MKSPCLLSGGFLIIPPLFLVLTVLILPPSSLAQEKAPAPTETVKYFKTRLMRTDILRNEIDAEQASRVNHFRAVYDHRGNLLRIEFVPRGDLQRKRVRKRDLFPRPQAPFRYFRAWNPYTKSLGNEIPQQKVSGGPFYRVSYLDSVHVKTVEYFLRRNRLLWTYYLQWNPEETHADLHIVFATRRPLTVLDPHLFHPAASEMRPGWIAEFRQNRLGRPLGLTVRDDVGNVYYFYRFEHSYETVGDTLNPVTHRVTSARYFRSDSTLIGAHRLVFSEENSLLKKEFYDARGDLTESIEYEYDPELEEVSVVIRDPKGNILHRQVLPQRSD
ncbi:MAG: hypothetical protein ACE5HZ_06170 [Fidelibacterota bacterium]